MEQVVVGRPSRLNACNLPQKHIYNVFITLSETQAALYRMILAALEATANPQERMRAAGRAIHQLTALVDHVSLLAGDSSLSMEVRVETQLFASSL